MTMVWKVMGKVIYCWGRKYGQHALYRADAISYQCEPMVTHLHSEIDRDSVGV